MSTSTPFTRTDATDAQGRRSSRFPRRLLSAAGAVAIAIVFALIGTGTSYALWNGRTTVNASSVTSGSTSITIDGQSTAYALDALDTTKLGPGQSVITPTPFVIQNTGTTRLAITVSGTTVPSASAALAAELSLTLSMASTCAVGTSGVTAPLVGFTTTATPIVLAPGGSVPVCLQATLDLDAPATLQAKTATFTLAIDAAQVR
ncbi:MAG: hypothetical protein RI885_2691 [Actinomycetota bacterium]|jgi:hypothetical protein